MGWQLLLLLLTTSVGGSAPGRWAWFPTHKLTSAGLQDKVQLRISEIQLQCSILCPRHLKWVLCKLPEALHSLRPCHLDERLLNALFVSLSSFLSYHFVVSDVIHQHCLSIWDLCFSSSCRRYLETQPKISELLYCEEGKYQCAILLNFLLPPDSGSIPLCSAGP